MYCTYTGCYITNHSPDGRDVQLSSQLAEQRNYQIQLPQISLAVREWGPESGIPLVALHGWLDNSASFEPLVGDAGWLEAHNIRFIAIDSAGHGHSGHRAKGQSYVLLDNVDDLHQFIKGMDFNQKPVLLGHSMGGGIATLYAGTEVADLSCLILIESLGPVSNSAADAPTQLSKHLQHRHRHQSQERTVYKDLDAVIAVRTENGDLPEQHVAALIKRNMKATPDGYRWRSDPRLRVASAMYLSHHQVEAFVANIACPTLLIYAEDGPWPNYPVLGERANMLQNKQIVSLTGGHHLHMTNQHKVREEIIKYISKTVG